MSAERPSRIAANRLCPRKALFENYMKDNAAPETLQFLQRLEEWNRCPAGHNR